MNLPPALSQPLSGVAAGMDQTFATSRNNQSVAGPECRAGKRLMALNVDRLDGCVLVSGEPRLLQAGLNAGLWTIGLASCGSLVRPGAGAMASIDPAGTRHQARQGHRCSCSAWACIR